MRLRDGSWFRGALWQVDAGKARLHFAGHPDRAVACAELETLKGESSRRRHGREALFAGVTVGSVWAGVSLMFRTTSYAGPALVVASPLAGWAVSRKALPRRVTTYRVVCR